MKSKQEFRRYALEIRKNIPEEIRKQKSEKISQLVLHSDLYKNTDILLLYAAVNGEPDLKQVAERALQDGKKLAYPRCTAEGVMVFHQVTSLSSLKVGKYKIPEPDENAPTVADFSNALCITPGVAFSKTNQRIGYGGGYYDRFLCENSCVALGVSYKELVFDLLPQEENDKKTDFLFYA